VPTRRVRAAFYSHDPDGITLESPVGPGLRERHHDGAEERATADPGCPLDVNAAMPDCGVSERQNAAMSAVRKS